MKRVHLLSLVIPLALAATATTVLAQGLPYPTRTPMQIKGAGLGPYDSLPRVQVYGNNGGGVVFNLFWDSGEPTHKSVSLGCTVTEFAYDGFCFRIIPEIDTHIKEFSDNGVNVTGVFSWSPSWATVPCSNPAPAPGGGYCAVGVTHIADYARFVGAMAWRYNGLNGHGRIVNFVIHNEVNANIWFDIGCGWGEGTPCDVNAWVASYAANYNAAYDRIKSEQAAAKVLVPTDYRFFGADLAGHLTVKSFLLNFAPRVGAREWLLAFHAGIPSTEPAFGPEIGSPFATPGSIGLVVGWLRQAFPSTPSAWEVHLTENGIPTPNRPGGSAEQAGWLCSAFGNVLGTPGVTSYLYTPVTTWPTYDTQELIECQPMGPGNAICNPSTFVFKHSWATWALSNGPGTLNCGFENLPYVKLSRYYIPGRGHWGTTRVPPPGAGYETAWKLLREPAVGTHMLYECRAPGFGTTHSLVTQDPNCENLEPLGPLGYAYDAPGPGRVPLYRCASGAGPGTHLISSHANCEGLDFEGLQGYVLMF